MRRRVEALDAFYELLSTLDRSEATIRAGRALLLRTIRDPERGAPVPGYRMWIIKSRRYGAFPPLRLYYAFDETKIYLLWIEIFDDLA